MKIGIMDNGVLMIAVDLYMVRDILRTIGECIIWPFVWLYYMLSELIDIVAFYGPDVLRAARRGLIRLCRLAAGGMLAAIRGAGICVIATAALAVKAGKALTRLQAWLSEAWMFRAAVVAECRA